ncbi:MAG: peptidoglycan editing factor PgeF [Calditrichaceae bacterium]|nr:peptidoglycan editing factor PgeF [Calditrichaceae bacterium]MBN2709530.1 peptidoglycan editing factor PgeF [Calditrichaceae bacterium]RQV93935.1 MAG: peptidoglycan editing factor PgeF [Calditrichota bacterium]
MHAFSTRKGGLSKGIFAGLNLGLNTNDDKESIAENRKLFFDVLDISEKNLAIPGQIHSDRVSIVEEPGFAGESDALITNKRGIFLTIQTADCFPVFLFDSKQNAVGLVHSGWRGAAQNIVGKTIQSMRDYYNCKPENISTAIGPGIQQNCYQVDRKTAAYFTNAVLKPDGENHYLLDLQLTIINQLINYGIPADQIETDGRCTHCEKELFYSYRRDGNQSGRMMSLIGLKN